MRAFYGFLPAAKQEVVVGAPEDFHRKFVCRWQQGSAGSETTVANFLVNGIMSTTCATELLTKFHGGSVAFQSFLGTLSLVGVNEICQLTLF